MLQDQRMVGPSGHSTDKGLERGKYGCREVSGEAIALPR